MEGIRRRIFRYRDNISKIPLIFIEEDIQFPFLTQDFLVLGQTLVISNQDPPGAENKHLQKRQKCT